MCVMTGKKIWIWYKHHFLFSGGDLNIASFFTCVIQGLIQGCLYFCKWWEIDIFVFLHLDLPSCWCALDVWMHVNVCVCAFVCVLTFQWMSWSARMISIPSTATCRARTNATSACDTPIRWALMWLWLTVFTWLSSKLCILTLKHIILNTHALWTFSLNTTLDSNAPC